MEVEFEFEFGDEDMDEGSLFRLVSLIDRQGLEIWVRGICSSFFMWGGGMVVE